MFPAILAEFFSIFRVIEELFDGKGRAVDGMAQEA